ncbi:hypothetical protein E3P92_03113 [Wallemia ichthyophaga]|nr:hypothetical protein E3P98_02843 [Wallemia ichthyophaga]TIA98785.1 hypothetical protein E3P94_02819 [Wallemia ichthyophaga]TIB10712.1 hypothetical protein E3P92_03113 [Wallemia ichthyophaga]TIB10912.1 hypothetical protein E3P90_02655 [Wallemia ichthyophaga]TIB11177.1 hypothetical protein E3P93_02663 [Wallemia ichthyophaga]
MDKLNLFSNLNTNKSIFNQLQAAREKFGAVDEADITTLPNDYIELENKVDALESVHKHLLKVTKVYENESYDYPVQFHNSISEQSGQLWHSFSSFANSNLKNVNIPQPTAPVPQPKTLSHALSRAAATSALEIGEIDHLGNALTKFALAHDKIGNGRLVQDNDILIGFLQPWQTTLNTSIQLAKNARSQVRNSRLWLDSCKQGLKTASPQKVEQARLEMESAEDKLVTQTETAISLMKNVLENPEPLTSLNKLVKAQISYHSASVEALNTIQGDLEDIQRSAEDDFK